MRIGYKSRYKSPSTARLYYLLSRSTSLRPSHSAPNTTARSRRRTTSKSPTTHTKSSSRAATHLRARRIDDQLIPLTPPGEPPANVANRASRPQNSRIRAVVVPACWDRAALKRTTSRVIIKHHRQPCSTGRNSCSQGYGTKGMRYCVEHHAGHCHPLVLRGIVLLDGAELVLAIKAAHHIQFAIEHRRRRTASCRGHRCNCLPGILSQIVPLDGAEPVLAVMAAHHIQFAIEHRRCQLKSSRGHR